MLLEDLDWPRTPGGSQDFSNQFPPGFFIGILPIGILPIQRMDFPIAPFERAAEANPGLIRQRSDN